MFLPIPHLTQTNRLAIANRSEAEAKPQVVEDTTTRDLFLQETYAHGGNSFLNAVANYGRNEKGEPLAMPRWWRETLLLIGDLRLHETLVLGNAQCGKTLSHTLLMCWLITEGRLSGAWFYASRNSMELNVPAQFRPVIERWLDAYEKNNHVIRSPRDRQLLSRYEVGGVLGIFTYVSGTKTTPSREGLAKAGGAVVSFSTDLLIYEERSQWPVGTSDPLPRRLDASPLIGKPIRQLGTPGAGLGIESELKKADRHFYPHYTCTSCGKTLPLDPKGCLLRPSRRRNALGKVEISYLSESGRPVEWYAKDSSNPVDTAYIGCSECGAEIPKRDRVESWMQCKRTGDRVDDFTDGLGDWSQSLPSPVPRYTIGIHFSPLVRDTEFDLAVSLIRDGLSCDDTADWQQQALGHPSEHQVSSLTQEMLVGAMGLRSPEREPDFILAGVDVGRSEDWLWICGFYLPEGYEEMERAIASEQTIRQVLFADGVIRDDIPDVLRRFIVKFGIIDNEPDRESAIRLCRQSNLQIADQKAGYSAIAKKDKVVDGGRTYPCWFFRSEKFLSAVQEGFLLSAPDGEILYRLPSSWKKWVGNRSDRSPIVHLSGPSRDPATGVWKRGPRHVDDLYYAAMFCELAFYLQFTGKRAIAMADFESAS